MKSDYTCAKVFRGIAKYSNSWSNFFEIFIFRLNISLMDFFNGIRYIVLEYEKPAYCKMFK